MTEQITADWKDVQQKSYRLLIDNDMDIDAISTFSILCEAHGDHDDYQCYVNNKSRVNKDNSPSKANWYCTCPWGKWSNTGRRPHDGPDSYGSVKVNNRFCSHAYAAYILLQQYRKLHKDEMQKQKDEQNQQDQIEEPTDYNKPVEDVSTEGLEDQTNQNKDQTDQQEDESDQFDLEPETEQYTDPEQLENDINNLVDGTESESDDNEQ